MDKRFSVGMSTPEKYEQCSCGKPLGQAEYRLNGEYVCRECFTKTKRWDYSDDGRTFNTPKDGLFNFVDIDVTGRPVQITGKKHWQDHLKKHNCHDDVRRIKSESDFEYKQQAMSKQEYKKILSKEYRENINRIKAERRRG